MNEVEKKVGMIFGQAETSDKLFDMVLSLIQEERQGAVDKALEMVDKFLSAPKRNKYYNKNSIDTWDIVGLRYDLEEKLKSLRDSLTDGGKHE